ncbi:transposase family protein, partial [mine drainage metagenome]
MSIIRKGLQLGPNLPQIPPDPFVESILANPVGAAPLIAALCREIGIPQLIDQEATWDKDRCILSPGERITALVINLLCEERRPLYKVEDNFKKLDTELLFGKGILPSHFNDDCLGRGLDALWEIGPTSLFRRAAANVRAMESL